METAPIYIRSEITFLMYLHSMYPFLTDTCFLYVLQNRYPFLTDTSFSRLPQAIFGYLAIVSLWLAISFYIQSPTLSIRPSCPNQKSIFDQIEPFSYLNLSANYILKFRYLFCVFSIYFRFWLLRVLYFTYWRLTAIMKTYQTTRKYADSGSRGRLPKPEESIVVHR